MTRQISKIALDPRRLAWGLTALVALFSGRLQAAETTIAVASGFDYSSGKYGDQDSTQLLVIPLSISAETISWIYGANVPYLLVRSDDRVLVTDTGIFVGNAAAGAARLQTIRGPADLTTFATYKVPETDAGWLIDLTGRLKWPTASRAKGFSTGKVDYGVQMNLARRLDRYTPHAKVAYQVRRGEIDDQLKNGWAANVGVKRRLGDSTSVDFTYEYRQPSSGFGFKQSEVSIAFGYTFSANWRAVIYGVKGLADGSPDRAIGATLEARI